MIVPNFDKAEIQLTNVSTFYFEQLEGKILRTVTVCLPCADWDAQVEGPCADLQKRSCPLNLSTLQPWCFAICDVGGKTECESKSI